MLSVSKIKNDDNVLTGVHVKMSNTNLRNINRWLSSNGFTKLSSTDMRMSIRDWTSFIIQTTTSFKPLIYEIHYLQRYGYVVIQNDSTYQQPYRLRYVKPLWYTNFLSNDTTDYESIFSHWNVFVEAFNFIKANVTRFFILLMVYIFFSFISIPILYNNIDLSTFTISHEILLLVCFVFLLSSLLIFLFFISIVLLQLLIILINLFHHYNSFFWCILGAFFVICIIICVTLASN